MLPGGRLPRHPVLPRQKCVRVPSSCPARLSGRRRPLATMHQADLRTGALAVGHRPACFIATARLSSDATLLKTEFLVAGRGRAAECNDPLDLDAPLLDVLD